MVCETLSETLIKCEGLGNPFRKTRNEVQFSVIMRFDENVKVNVPFNVKANVTT